MNNDYLVKQSTLSDIANSIREKTGSTGPMTVNEMPEAIASINGGGSIQTCTVSIDYEFVDLYEVATLCYSEDLGFYFTSRIGTAPIASEPSTGPSTMQNYTIDNVVCGNNNYLIISTSALETYSIYPDSLMNMYNTNANLRYIQIPRNCYNISIILRGDV
jgi:hypothetical protein